MVSYSHTPIHVGLRCRPADLATEFSLCALANPRSANHRILHLCCCKMQRETAGFAHTRLFIGHRDCQFPQPTGLAHRCVLPEWCRARQKQFVCLNALQSMSAMRRAMALRNTFTFYLTRPVKALSRPLKAPASNHSSAPSKALDCCEFARAKTSTELVCASAIELACYIRDCFGR